MKRFRKTKERVLGFALALVMVVSVIAGGNMFEVKAESSNTYAPYYDATTNQVCGIEVGNVIYPTTVMDIENLGDDILYFTFYENEEDIEDEYWDFRAFSKADEKMFNEQGIEYSYTIGDSMIGNYDKTLGWTINKVHYNANYKKIEVYAVAIDKPDAIETAILTFDWTKFKVSESLEESEEDYGFWVTMSGTGVKQSDDPYRYLKIKATQEHVEAGYISEYDLQTVDSKGYLSIWNYNDNYKIGAKDEVMYSLEISAEEGYAFTNETSVRLVGDNVMLEGVWLASDFSKNTRLLLNLNLGTGADIEEAINASTQEPTIPPTTGGEVVFTDETADAILEASEIIVNAKCENVWESTENDPYAYPVYVKTNADGSKEYELGNSDDAEAYIRIDYTYTMADGTELTWLENYTDATHPNSMYDKSYPIVLKDADGNIYVDMTSYGMSEGSFDETIGVVPKDIYDGYMDWLIGKFTDGGSNTPTDDEKEPVTPPTTNTTNDHKADLENKTDVKTKIELTEDEKTAIASGEELEVVLVFTDAGTKADNDEKKAIEKQLGDNSLGVFLDIELIKKIGSTEVKVSETKGLVTITFEMPEELKNKDASVTRTYKIMRYHDGKVDVLDAKYDSKTGKLSFETDKFSTYAIVYSDAKTNSTTTSTPAPQTGDATNTFVYIALLGLALCSVVFVLRKQRKF